MKNLPEQYYTYYQKRECLNCYELIPDQEHAATKFCPREEMPDGTIKSCKDDFHSLRRKDTNLPYKRISDYHKATHGRLKNLWGASKEGCITIEQLNLNKINLHRPFEITVDGNQKATYYFVEFAITSLPNNQLKIFKHGRNI